MGPLPVDPQSTDSPCLRVKPRPDTAALGERQVAFVGDHDRSGPGRAGQLEVGPACESRQSPAGASCRTTLRSEEPAIALSASFAARTVDPDRAEILARLGTLWEADARGGGATNGAKATWPPRLITKPSVAGQTSYTGDLTVSNAVEAARPVRRAGRGNGSARKADTAPRSDSTSGGRAPSASTPASTGSERGTIGTGGSAALCAATPSPSG